MFLLFPTQLFKNTKLLKNKNIYLIEEPYYFTRLKFHKLKLAYHRATMKKYYDFLNKKFDVKYIEFDKVTSFYETNKNKDIELYHPTDIPLLKQLEDTFKNVTIHETLNFTFTHLEVDEMKNACYKNNKYYHDEFYKFQRKRLDILMDENDKPVDGKYSFDDMNRNKFDSNITIPELPKVQNNKYITESIKYVLKHFKDNYGSLDNFIYPINFNSTKKWLENFLKKRLVYFGKYQDAVDTNIDFGFHAVISPMMNIGLITDSDVIKQSYNFYNKYKKKYNIPINSFEGFIRQVIGWRNYIYLIYLSDGDKIRKMNYLKHKNKLNYKFWEATTNITPIDDIIKKIDKYSYAHHIERLMYLGNFMLIAQIHPNEVYRIFMEWTIDAYDWVMVPNVYGMTQFADGGLMMTRPYFSSSNYIFKMSNYKKSKTIDNKWWEIWDAIYYDFINKHHKLLKKNYATSRQVAHWDKKTKKEQNNLLKISKNFIKTLL